MDIQCDEKIEIKSTIKKSTWFWFAIFVLGIFVKDMFPDYGELSLYQDTGIVLCLVGMAAMVITNAPFRPLNAISSFFLIVSLALIGAAVFFANNIIQDYNSGPQTAIMTNCNTYKTREKTKYYFEGEIDGKRYEFVVDSDIYDALDDKLYVLDEETYDPKHTPVKVEYYVKTKKLVSYELMD